MMRLGDCLRILRTSRNISQREIAQRIGISRSAYGHYESNKRLPMYETLIKLAAFFDVSVDDLIRDAVASNKPEPYDDAVVRHIMQLIRQMDRHQKESSIRLLSALVHGTEENAKPRVQRQ